MQLQVNTKEVLIFANVEWSVATCVMYDLMKQGLEFQVHYNDDGSLTISVIGKADKDSWTEACKTILEDYVSYIQEKNEEEEE